MELNHLRAFYEVAKSGRFVEAAARLHISQSALSRSVALLEEAEGVKLFERSRKGVVLTTTGQEVFRYCEQLFQTVQKIEESCRGMRENCEGMLRFSTTDHVMNDLLIGPLAKMKNDFPLVIPSVFVGPPDDIIHSLLTTEAEFGLLFSKVVSPQIHFEPLRQDTMALVVSADLWRANKQATSASTLQEVLKKVGYISSIGAHSQTRPSRVLIELFGKMPPIGCEVNSQEAQKRLCIAGEGIAYLARFMVEKEIRAGLLHDVALEAAHPFNLWLATRKGRSLSLAARTLLDRLRAIWAK